MVKGPLSGVRLLALERYIAGPYGSMVLADLGAEVIKIEPPGSGDVSRSFPGPGHRGESFYYLAFNRGKKSITLDINTETGKGIFYDLVKVSDVVWDNFSAGTMQRIGADFDTLKEINPGIICCSISGYGQTGPYKDRLCYDVVAEAISGAMSITGEPGRPPIRYGAPIADELGGLFGALGVTSALTQRAQTGKGTRIDTSLLDEFTDVTKVDDGHPVDLDLEHHVLSTLFALCLVMETTDPLVGISVGLPFTRSFDYPRIGFRDDLRFVMVVVLVGDEDDVRLYIRWCYSDIISVVGVEYNGIPVVVEFKTCMTVPSDLHVPSHRWMSIRVITFFR